MSRRALLKWLVPAAILLSHSPAWAENRLALVIGQSAYKSVPALPNPANDAKAMTELLSASGFQVVSASDLSQNELRAKVGEFASEVAAKGADTVALVFYAGHGLQVDGENFLIPVDVDPKREADIAVQAVRLNDILNTLNSVPTRMRIVLLDACRNNPFPTLKTAGNGLAIVDAKTGVPGTFVSFSTSPGAEAEDGSGANSPYTTALLTAAKDPAPIEETFKRVRVAVNKVTDGRQTPWDSSSLTEDFRFAAPMTASGQGGPKLAATKRTVEEWTRDLKGKPVEAANEIIVADGTDEAYEAFATLFASTPRGLQARDWLNRHRRMVAWNNAVLINTAASYRAFLAQYPDSDLTATARRLEERLRNKPIPALALATPATNAALTCPCNNQPQPAPLKKADTPTKKPDTTRRAGSRPPAQVYDDVVVVRRPPPVVYEPAGPPVVYERSPPVSIGIGVGVGGGYGPRDSYQGRRGY
ncbi:caspase family protein [Bradyrhizobium liaoningense]|uniref:caspase family protein n=1 Tax=Bradyrhizobium liaoningense TaxID=43992 RepID=UPI001BAD2E17|nr:caspase family protein [Bradyrhizobium liaoningense]MBR0718198.1 caspase family protein [Bradyrhizobium liaoningense]